MGCFQLSNIDCANGCCHAVRVPQAKQPYVIGAVRVKSVFGVPQQCLLATCSDLFVLVALDRQYVVDQISVLLRRPSEKVSKKTTAKYHEDLLVQRFSYIGPPFPVSWSRSNHRNVYRVA